MQILKHFQFEFPINETSKYSFQKKNKYSMNKFNLQMIIALNKFDSDILCMKNLNSKHLSLEFSYFIPFHNCIYFLLYDLSTSVYLYQSIYAHTEQHRQHYVLLHIKNQFQFFLRGRNIRCNI